MKLDQSRCLWKDAPRPLVLPGKFCLGVFEPGVDGVSQKNVRMKRLPVGREVEKIRLGKIMKLSRLSSSGIAVCSARCGETVSSSAPDVSRNEAEPHVRVVSESTLKSRADERWIPGGQHHVPHTSNGSATPGVDAVIGGRATWWTPAWSRTAGRRAAWYAVFPA
jgi:hypothetical protein